MFLYDFSELEAAIESEDLSKLQKAVTKVEKGCYTNRLREVRGKLFTMFMCILFFLYFLLSVTENAKACQIQDNT